jgi:hypothetical protein
MNVLLSPKYVTLLILHISSFNEDQISGDNEEYYLLGYNAV